MGEKMSDRLRKDYDSLLLSLGLTLLFLLILQTFQTGLELKEMPILDREAAYERRLMLEMMGIINKFTCVFAAISCLFLSQIWIQRREREYRIFRILGYDSLRLFGVCLKESCRVMGISFLIALAVQAVLTVFREGAGLSLKGGLICLAGSALGAFLLHLAVMVFPFLILLKKPLTQENLETE